MSDETTAAARLRAQKRLVKVSQALDRQAHALSEISEDAGGGLQLLAQMIASASKMALVNANGCARAAAFIRGEPMPPQTENEGSAP
jgi:hypothetical protein